MEWIRIDIYIKPVKKASLSERNYIMIKDVAEVVAPAKIAEKVKVMKLMAAGGEADGKSKANYLVSITDIIRRVNQDFPDCSVVNVGEMDTVVEYARVSKKDSPLFRWIKVAFVAAVLLSGSATALMSFHTDAQIPKVFENYYKIFYGEEKSNPLIIDIPYSIGLAAGIIVFYNHFMGKKLTDDPTPIEIEMTQYEAQVNDTVLDVLNTKRSEQAEDEPWQR